ncbi:hypothetical protein SSCG_05477 [Streptomyces clavuligerus]|nr:hypothetical protein SSCG_05477 [Streptomyces clavuligerus]
MRGRARSWRAATVWGPVALFRPPPEVPDKGSMNSIFFCLYITF